MPGRNGGLPAIDVAKTIGSTNTAVKACGGKIEGTEEYPVH